ncbi:MAG: hypothetical protein EPN91_13110 [Salinibacterium sp.]|nr:MAG: hypothetical protein EPN91_13110 [Salinibacterium sp.]
MIAPHVAAQHVRALHDVSAKIDEAYKVWQTAVTAEDRVCDEFTAGRASLDDLKAANVRSNEAWTPYKALCDEGERILAASKASRVTS